MTFKYLTMVCAGPLLVLLKWQLSTWQQQSLLQQPCKSDLQLIFKRERELMVPKNQTLGIPCIKLIKY